MQELSRKISKTVRRTRFIAGAKSVSGGVIKVYFWPGKGQQAFDSNDDVNVNDNNNDERDFVDNYMEIRVPQKVKESYPRMEEAQNLLKCILPFSPATVRQCVIT